jgi:hypothetical protein
MSAGVITVAPVGATMASLSCVTVALSPTVALPNPLLPSGAVIETDPPVAVEPAFVNVKV